MSKHTPGPWEWNSGYKGLRNAKCENVLTHVPWEGMHVSYHTEVATREANARLIAAAPDLLAALEAFVSIDYRSWDADAQTKWEACYAAIAKAKGTQP